MPDRMVRGLYLEPGVEPAVVVLNPWGPAAVRQAIGSDLILQRSLDLPGITDHQVAVFHPAFYPNGHLQADDSPLDEHLPALVVVHKQWRVIDADPLVLTALATLLVSQEYSPTRALKGPPA